MLRQPLEQKQSISLFGGPNYTLAKIVTAQQQLGCQGCWHADCLGHGAVALGARPYQRGSVLFFFPRGKADSKHMAQNHKIAFTCLQVRDER